MPSETTDTPERKTFAERCRAMSEGLRSGQLTGGDLRMAATLLDDARKLLEGQDDARDVRRFARRMEAKMLRQAAHGWSGWRDMTTHELWDRLREQADAERDPIDIANYAMMLHVVSETKPIPEAAAGDDDRAADRTAGP